MALRWRLSYKRLKSGRFSYPYGEMLRGQYIVVPRRLAKRATSAAYVFGQKHRKYFMCRTFGTRGRVRITYFGGY